MSEDEGTREDGSESSRHELDVTTTIDDVITFGCYYGGKFEKVCDKIEYVGGGYRMIDCRPSLLFPELMNRLPISLYGQRVWYKVPFEDINDRRLVSNGDDNFERMCRAAFWTKLIEIFVEADVESVETENVETEIEFTLREETQRVETPRVQRQRDVNDHYDHGERSERENAEENENAEDAENEDENENEREDAENEREDAQREENHYPEEERVEDFVRDFVDDEEFDEYFTPVCSDDEEYDGLTYFRYVKGSGELKIRMAFDSVDSFKKAMIDYVLKNGWNVKYCRWHPEQPELKCASVAEEGEEPCLWKIYCSYEPPLQKYMVKTYIKEHTCSKSRRSKLITQEVIAKLFLNELRINPSLTPKYIGERIDERWDLIVTYDQCKNGRNRALEIIKEEHDLQFSKLRLYRLELLKSNPESTVQLDTYPGQDGDEYFDRFYVCFAGIKQTWMSHCRPIFGLDGCFLKCTTKGQLLAAVGRDANNQMFPIAWAVVEVENEDNWMWFIKKLQKDLNLFNGGGFTVISD